jgi:tryptophan halogenase
VVIAGGGTAGWMVAAALSKTLGALLDITLIESDEIGTVGVGEATIPSLQTFHQLLGIDEREFMSATQATFKLGIQFEHWRQLGESYLHGFGQTGKDHWTAGFQHFWLKGRQRQLAADYGAYALEVQAAQSGRFASLPDGGLHYAYHLDATRYAAFLRRMSQALGVQRVEGKIVAVKPDPQSLDIRALRLDSGAEIEGDLFIDCTGFRALLIGETLGVEYEDWSHWLFNDSAVAVQTASVGDALPYTRSIAHGWGWQWRIPLQHRVGNGLVYSSRYVDDAQAAQALLANVEGERLTSPRVLRFSPGQRRQAWHRNCLAVGLSSGFLEPLESTSIYLIQRHIIRLLQMFPRHGVAASDIEEFNRQTRVDIEHVRDFIILHYRVTNRQDTPYWRACSSMDVPATLQHRIELFRETARVFRAPGELFAENSWIQVMLGQGLLPRQHHPVADLMGDAELGRFLDGIRSSVAQTVSRMPPHQAWVDRYCGATGPAGGSRTREIR